MVSILAIGMITSGFYIVVFEEQYTDGLWMVLAGTACLVGGLYLLNLGRGNWHRRDHHEVRRKRAANKSQEMPRAVYPARFRSILQVCISTCLGGTLMVASGSLFLSSALEGPWRIVAFAYISLCLLGAVICMFSVVFLVLSILFRVPSIHIDHEFLEVRNLFSWVRVPLDEIRKSRIRTIGTMNVLEIEYSENNNCVIFPFYSDDLTSIQEDICGKRLKLEEQSYGESRGGEE
jgi:hypothetical protein